MDSKYATNCPNHMHQFISFSRINSSLTSTFKYLSWFLFFSLDLCCKHARGINNMHVTDLDHWLAPTDKVCRQTEIWANPYTCGLSCSPADYIFSAKAGWCWTLTFRAHMRVSVLHVSRSLNKMENSLCSWPGWRGSKRKNKNTLCIDM